MTDGRLDRWDETEVLHYTAFTWEGAENDEDPAPEDEELIDRLEARGNRYYEESDYDHGQVTSSDIVRACKELIYDVVDGDPVFHAVAYKFNVSRAEIEVGPMLDILVSGGEEPTDESIRSTLAWAYITETPVYPNTDALTDDLAEHYRDLMVKGFTAPDESGEPVRLKLTDTPGADVDSIDHLRNIRLDQPRDPAEIALMRRAVERELNSLTSAQEVLGALGAAIEELESTLDASERNEAALQKCLTSYPILFGLEYREIVPKHKLGDDFEMDYALRRISGVYDMIEIEASTHELYTLKGKPRSQLVHAEQQVLDWLEWLDQNRSYASKKLPGLTSPTGYVVIGRSKGLSDDERQKLRRRNQMWRGRIRILTYDDLLRQARTMRSILLGEVETE